MGVHKDSLKKFAIVQFNLLVDETNEPNDWHDRQKMATKCHVFCKEFQNSLS